MTSCVVFFFLVSLISSNTAAPPPGVKVRITESNTMKDVGVMYLKELVNKQFSIDKIYLPIRSVKLTELQVDPAKVDFKFQDNIGLQIEIKDMKLSIEIQREAKVPFTQINIFEGMTTLIAEGTRATLIVRMNRNPQGHLNVDIPRDNCIINTDTSRTTSTGRTGFAWNLFYQFLFNQFCLVLRPIINYNLKDLPMMRTVHEDRQLDLDYSLSSDIGVTSRSLDISFKGLMSVHGQAVDTDSIRPGREPVFTETNKMIYVGISEFFFNGAAMAIYNSGPFEFNVPELEGWKSGLNPGLKALGIKPGIWTVELTEAPIIEISKAGPSATVNFKAQNEAHQIKFLMICQFNMDIGFKERLLIMNIQKPKCKDKTGKTNAEILAGVVNVFHKPITKRFVPDIPIPLLAELSIIDAKTQFEEGYLVVGGSLTFNPQSSSNAGR
ncbi:phospholipid transfer protein-like [Oreochromis niloticus]|uniref:phospholipid transfer protein-like n=1 Tax=Oreochromis niloticus TaxID=8128 RepID=UPI0009055C6C|nr:phospholipid transfer protein-like [Oreochromis niloticus]